MTAQVPYLARLARQAGGTATLLPPRQLFAGDTHTPVRSPGRDDSLRRLAGGAAAGGFPRTLPPSDAGEEPPAQPGTALPRGVDVHADRPGGAPAPSAASAELTPGAGAPALPAPSAAGAMAAGGPVAPGAPDVPGPPDVAFHPSPAARTESARAAGPTWATPAHAGPVAQPVTPPSAAQPVTPPPAAQPVTPPPAAQPVTPPPGGSGPAGGTARAQPPGSWTSPLRGTPADLVRATELVPVTGDTNRRSPSRPDATAPPPGPEPAATAGAYHGPPRIGAGIPATPPPGPGPASTARPQPGPPQTGPGNPPAPGVTPTPGVTATPGGPNAGEKRPGTRRWSAISSRLPARLAARSPCPAPSRPSPLSSRAFPGRLGYRSARSTSPSCRRLRPLPRLRRSGLRRRRRAAGLARLPCSPRPRAPTGCGTGSAAGTGPHKADGGER